MRTKPFLLPSHSSEDFDVVETTLNYYLDPADGGPASYIPGTAGSFRRKHDPRTVQVHDMRGHEEDFTLNNQAFQLCKISSIEKEFTDTETIKRVVYPEIENLLKKVTGATKVHVFSHLVRRDPPEKNELAMRAMTATASSNSDSSVPDSKGLGNVVPARFAHVDQSPAGALTILKDHFPDSAATLTKTRWGTINVWRPLKPIKKDPFAVCDAQSVPDEDLVPVYASLPPATPFESVSVGEGFETLELRANPDHRWYYVSDMKPDEALLFKMYDSKTDVGRRVPHTSFIDPRTKNEAPRESLEVRSFLFYEDQPIS